MTTPNVSYQKSDINLTRQNIVIFRNLSACISPNPNHSTIRKRPELLQKGSNKRTKKTPAPLAAANNPKNQALSWSQSIRKVPITSHNSKQKRRTLPCSQQKQDRIQLETNLGTKGIVTRSQSRNKRDCSKGFQNKRDCAKEVRNKRDCAKGFRRKRDCDI